ncbi:alpha/beta hydrolase [Paenibacillus sp. D2_2]|uniref:alpha/beta fold hydrolase n=1 Tax=Paenibacillus sp. D2_2 TaxID=3073092 RepID=UPI0028154D16|nr:alpha/beta hydrolase [Paenibacillus sp. D2_2]WMT40912.1 alpha/beta hydrolase [Paenibacillus sp. D2_2]
MESNNNYQVHVEQRLTFVLVHGSWADAHFWDGIATALRRNGHVVYTPEYAGHGDDPNKNVTHAMVTNSVVDFITELNLHDIILVGHSFGGTVIQKVAEQVPDRIKRLVFWDAFVLKDGESLADELPPQTRQGFEQLRASSKDDTIMLPFPLFRELFVNTATLDVARQIYAGVVPNRLNRSLRNWILRRSMHCLHQGAMSISIRTTYCHREKAMGGIHICPCGSVCSD